MTAEPTALWLSANHWEWIDRIGLVLVFIGVAMEFVADRSYWYEYFPAEKRRLETRALFVLLLGLGLETIASPTASYLNGLTLERERMARVQLEKQVAWRSFSPRRARAAVEKLGRFPAKVVAIHAYVGDTEGIALAKQIAWILKQAHWEGADPAQITLVMPNGPLLFEGVQIEVHKPDSNPRASSALLKVLIGSDMASTLLIARSAPEGVQVHVGIKPFSPVESRRVRQLPIVEPTAPFFR